MAVSGLSIAGSFAGLTAKGWILMDGTGNPMVLALHFAALALPSLLASGPAGVLTDRIGCETVLIRSQLGLFAAAVAAALALPLLQGPAQVGLLLLSTLAIGVASTYELTARNKYCALLVDQPQQLAPYLASFSVVFNVGKLLGPPLGGWLVATTTPAMALGIDAATYLVPMAAVIWLLHPDTSLEQRSDGDRSGSLRVAWRDCGPELRHVFRFSGLACLVIFFHPGLAPSIAIEVVGTGPEDLGVFTSVLAAGSVCGGLLLQRYSQMLSRRPGLLLGSCTLITGLAQLGMASWHSLAAGLLMTFLIGAGTASLLAGVNLISQVAAPMQLRGRMAALGQIAFLGGGGFSGLIAALLTQRLGLRACFALLGVVGLTLGIMELVQRGRRRLKLPTAPRTELAPPLR
ncbi:MAG: MFS transporter [Synechococcaceae cyanobacterium]|nr:MFS transporter [Synechococcaceae cyanobacterium]